MSLVRAIGTGARARSLAMLALLALTSLDARPARAEAPRTEAAAKQALAKAEDSYLAMAFPQGLAILRKAERACGDDRCSTATHAALLRDIGTFLFRAGDAAAAGAAFNRALKLDSTLELNPSYDARDLRVRWNAAKETIVTASQPGEGDFVHTPPREQKETTPLPIYVEYAGSEQLVRVIVKYKNDAMSDFKRATLSRVGTGWGGYVPCVDVTRGIVRYYVQGIDASGLPILASGSPKVPFTVPIHETLKGEAPALPGVRAPTTCEDEDLQTLRLEVGDRCQEDNQCKTGTCSAGRCARAPEIENVEGEHARFWLGVSGSVDVAFLPSGSDVCNAGVGDTPAYFCTKPGGADLVASQSDALVAGRAGQTDGGMAAGNVRILASFDYAASPNVLIGGRVGYVAQSYTGQVAIDAGRVISPAMHAEVRGTYLVGVDPLTLPGLVPYASLGAGYGRFDAGTRVSVARPNVVGEKAVQAWAVGGPFFTAVGTGLRYALSPRIGFSSGARFTLAFGAGGLLTNLSPELALQYGF